MSTYTLLPPVEPQLGCPTIAGVWKLEGEEVAKFLDAIGTVCLQEALCGAPAYVKVDPFLRTMKCRFGSVHPYEFQLDGLEHTFLSTSFQDVASFRCDSRSYTHISCVTHGHGRAKHTHLQLSTCGQFLHSHIHREVDGRVHKFQFSGTRYKQTPGLFPASGDHTLATHGYSANPSRAENTRNRTACLPVIHEQTGADQRTPPVAHVCCWGRSRCIDGGLLCTRDSSNEVSLHDTRFG